MGISIEQFLRRSGVLLVRVPGCLWWGGGRGQVVEAKLRAVLTDPWARQGGPENVLIEERPGILFIEYFD